MQCVKCKKDIPEGAIFCPWCGKEQQPKKKYKKRANGTGSITKLSGNRKKPWAARKNNILVGTYATRGEALKALERLTDANVTERFNMTFAEIYEAWLPEHSRMIGASGRGSYKTAYTNCKELHAKVFRTIRHSDFQSVIIRLEDDGKSKSTCEKVLQLFGQLSEWAIMEEIIQTNHARTCTIAAEQKSVGLVIPDEAIQRIQASKLPAAKIALLLLSTGCRPADLFTAKREDCYDTYFISGSKTEAGKARIIPVDTLGLEAYADLLHRSQGKPLLIDGYNGNHNYSNYAKRDWKKLSDEAHLEAYTPYDCRHTYITNAKRAGLDPQILRRIVGHADLSTTDKYYTHTDKDDILSAVSQKSVYFTVSNKLVTPKNPQK